MAFPKRWLAAFALSACAVAMAADEPGPAPAARTVDVVDHDFGLSLPDPYRWMEGEGNAEFAAWLKAQGAVSRARLDALPTLAAWRQRLAAAVGASTRHGNHTLVGDRLFFLRAPTGKEAMLMVRGRDGEERVLLDPNAIEGGASISNYSVSPDGGKVTLNIGYGGNEVGEVAVFDVASGERLADTLKPVWSEFNPSWLPDGSGFFYTRMRAAVPGDADPFQGMAVYLHRTGQAQAADTPIVRAGADDALHIAAHDFPVIRTTPGSDWALLSIGGARASMRVCVAPLADAVDSRATWRCLADDADNVQGHAVHGDTLYLLSAKEAPNRKVLALDLRTREAGMASARVVVPERADASIGQDPGLAAARDGLYLKTTRQGLDRVERMDYASRALTPVALPGEGTVALLRTDPRQDGALLSLENWTTPDRVYRFDGRAFLDTGLGRRGAPAYPGIGSEELEAVSADGTRVPLSVIRPEPLARDGHARAVVMGYGGYGIGIAPHYSTLSLEWVKAGNVMAICHVRGGDENGDSWRTAGTGPNKQRGIEDFIACARELAHRGYSTPARTGAFSASMGGILVGGAYTTAPQAWGAAAVQSGMFNAVRLLAEKNGANQIAEMGDPCTESGLKQLLAMDPYQHLRDGVRYPPLLLVTGAVDHRVAPWHSGKFGARVMAASPDTPIWFRTDEQAGHFATSGNSAALEFADVYAFFDAMPAPSP